MEFACLGRLGASWAVSGRLWGVLGCAWAAQGLHFGSLWLPWGTILASFWRPGTPIWSLLGRGAEMSPKFLVFY